VTVLTWFRSSLLLGDLERHAVNNKNNESRMIRIN